MMLPVDDFTLIFRFPRCTSSDVFCKVLKAISKVRWSFVLHRCLFAKVYRYQRRLKNCHQPAAEPDTKGQRVCW